MMQEHWKRVMAELVESTCNYCNNSIQKKLHSNKRYI